MNKDDLFDEVMKNVVEKDDGIIVDKFDLTGVVLKPYDPGEVIFPTHAAARLWGDPVSFNMETVIDQLEDYGKYKGILMCNGDKSENYIPVSVAKQIVGAGGRGGVLGYLEEDKGEIKDCSTCKNNVEYPPPHTCDICQSLDQEEDYEMWEEKR